MASRAEKPSQSAFPHADSVPFPRMIGGMIRRTEFDWRECGIAVARCRIRARARVRPGRDRPCRHRRGAVRRAA
ncbi:MAG: hypothetical protein ACTHOH_10135, partial [Lysobacteraceae bacterium]